MLNIPVMKNTDDVELNIKLKNHLNTAVLTCKGPRDTAAVSFHMIQIYVRLTILSAMNLAFFLAVTHLIEAGLASHFLQSVHCIGARSVSCAWSKCVDVHFE